MHTSHQAFAARTVRSRTGMTLLEVMGATLLFALVVSSILVMTVKAYQGLMVHRYREQSRAVIGSMANQFMRFGYSDTYALLHPTTKPTGLGLEWNGAFGDDPDSPLNIRLGDLTHFAGGNDLDTMPAEVTRDVRIINATTGAVIPGVTPAPDAVGYLLQATFTIRFRMKFYVSASLLDLDEANRDKYQVFSESITVTRLIENR